MIVLSTFLKSLLNFLSITQKKTLQNLVVSEKSGLNCQEHSLKEQSGTKSPVRASWSEKMTVLSTFLESSFNFLFNNLKKLRNQIQSGRKLV